MKLIPLSEISSLLDQLGVRPSKALGQNFLIDANIRDIMLDAVDLRAGDEVLEIGPGLGALTGPLSEKARRVMAIEKDRRLWAYLGSSLKHRSNLELVCADALELNPEELLKSGLNKLVSNLPYSSGSAILVNFMRARRLLERMVVTLQLEVARRLKAGPCQPDYGLLSIWCQLNYEVTRRKIVSPSCFFPSPKIKSAIMVLKRREQAQVKLRDAGFFFALTKYAFAHRRKQLRSLFNAIPAELSLGREAADTALRRLNLNPRLRPEALSVVQWGRLANELSK